MQRSNCANRRDLKLLNLYLTNSDIIMSFEELRLKFSLNRKHFFKYLQLPANQDNNLNIPPYSSLEKNDDKG